MKRATLEDFLTEVQIARCVALFEEHGSGATLHRVLLDEVVRPNMVTIDAKLGQPNDARYIAFMIESVLTCPGVLRRGHDGRSRRRDASVSFEREWEKPKPKNCSNCARVRAESAGAHQQCVACDAKDFMRRTDAERREHAAAEWDRRQAAGFIRKDLKNPFRRTGEI